MRNNLFKKITIPLILVFQLLINSCVLTNDPSPPELSGPCTETGNPTGIRGKILNAESKPLGGINLSFYENLGNDTTGSAHLLAKQSSCSNGTFAFVPNANATYSIEAFDSLTQTRAREPLIVYTLNQTVSLAPLTLQKSGTVVGMVFRDSNPYPEGIVAHEKVLVRLIHTDKSILTHTSGEFIFPSIAPGKYRLAFIAADGHYLTALSDSFLVEAGKTTVIPSAVLKWSPFVQPPTPAGLNISALNDSLIQLKWSKAFIDSPFYFEIERSDSLLTNTKDTLISLNSIYTDTIPSINRGHEIIYRIRLLNQLQNASKWSSGNIVKSILPETLTNPSVNVFVNVQANQISSPNIRVKLYRNPEKIGAADSLPLQTRLLDSALTDIQGNVLFQNLSQGDFSIEASDPISGTNAIKTHVKGLVITTPFSKPTDSLKLTATGTLKGLASRQKAWVTTFTKGNENIFASLVGTEYQAKTGFGFTPSDSEFIITGIPPGSYQLVIYALPEGYFLADTQFVTIRPNDTTTAKTIFCKYNPHATPLKPHGLKIDSIQGTNISLSWVGTSEAQLLKGYQITRLNKTSGEKFISPLLYTTSFTDNLSLLRSGTRLEYLVQAVTKDNQFSLYAGDDLGRPIEFSVP